MVAYYNVDLIPRVNSAQYQQQFNVNNLQIGRLSRDLQTPNYYRNTNLRAGLIAILTIAAIGGMYYCIWKKSIRPISNISVVSPLSIVPLGFWGVYSFVRSEANDRVLLEELRRSNQDLRHTVQTYIQVCEKNIKNCDVALNQDQLADGRPLNQRENLVYQVAPWTNTPWRAFESITSFRPSLQDLDGQTEFLRSEQPSITQFKQANEEVKGQLEALLLLLA